jgi:hypothetical protein
MNLYENGHLMEKDQVERAVDGLIGAVTEMVKLRKTETQHELKILKIWKKIINNK